MVLEQCGYLPSVPDYGQGIERLLSARGKEYPTHYKNIQDKLGEIYYRKHYEPETGLVKKDVNVMESHEVTYTANELADPHIRYYT